jgi:hypothetical protein
MGPSAWNYIEILDIAELMNFPLRLCNLLAYNFFKYNNLDVLGL